ncbi:MAG: T9SS type A sorting domain-containing protein [Bacteroidetes bacterium]|nr:T9SS type A sorting domain-containing protein [Bacteroidota bacterium]
MLKKLYLLSITFILSFTGLKASPWYVQDVAPWGQSTNVNAMNNVFGVGGWQQGNYSTSPAAIFSASTPVVFLEGSDQNAIALNNFLTANIALIENWVYGGGHLFINAAPNQGGNINLGFGNIVLDYLPTYSDTGIAVLPGDQIFNGPYTPVATNYSGGSFAHAFLTGPGLVSLMENDSAQILLARKTWGAGVAYFGTLTQPNFWNPNPQATNLWYNILSSVANGPVTPCTSPDSLTVANITTDGATFDWTGTATTYEYVIDSSANVPAGNGTTVFADSFIATGLMHDSTYYFHVRAVCDSNNKSAWITIAFTTAHMPDCAAPTGYASVSFTQVAPFATLHWSSPAATQYFWVLDNNASDPAVLGNATTNTQMSFANLTPNVTYYFHVRCICANGDTSAWTTIMFITASCPFPTATATVDTTQVGPFANVNWSSLTAASYLWVLDNTASDPMVIGNATTLSSMTFANLLTGHDYYFHIRSVCTNGDTSTWTTIMFHTPGPNSVVNVNGNGTTIVCSPNPVANTLTVTISGVIDNNANITLSGLDGKVIYSLPVTSSKTQIDMSKLPAALYFVKYTNKDYNDIIKVMKQ